MMMLPIIFLNSIGLFYSKMAADDYCVRLQIKTLGLWNSYYTSIIGGTPTFFSNVFTYLRLYLLNFNGIFLVFLYLTTLLIITKLILRNFALSEKKLLPLMLSIMCASFLNGVNLMMPITNQGAAFISTFGWSTARVLGLNLLVLLVLILRQVSLKQTILKYVLVLCLIGTDSALAVSGITMMFIFTNRNTRDVPLFARNYIIALVTLIGEVLSQVTPGQFARRRALDIGMRNGDPVNFDLDALNLGRYNFYRLTHESYDIRLIMSIFLLGIFISLFLKMKRETINENIRIFSVLVIVCTVFTVVASVIAYLQTWHFIAINHLVGFLIFFLGAWSGQKIKESKSISLPLKIFVPISALILGLNLILVASLFETTSLNRSQQYEVRSVENSNRDLPLLSLNETPLTEDLKSEWVMQCFNGL
jgi:hypothetical protein